MAPRASRPVLASVLVLALVGSWTGAGADTTPTVPTRAGTSLGGALTVGDCVGGYCSDNPPGFHVGPGLELVVLQRFLRRAGLGVTALHNKLDADITPFEAPSFSLFGAVAQYFFSEEGVWDPWIGLSMGFMHVALVAVCYDCAFDMEFSSTGAVIGLRGGVDYWLDDRLTLTLGGRFDLAVFTARPCFDDPESGTCMEVGAGGLPELVAFSLGLRYCL